MASNMIYMYAVLATNVQFITSVIDRKSIWFMTLKKKTNGPRIDRSFGLSVSDYVLIFPPSVYEANESTLHRLRFHEI